MLEFLILPFSDPSWTIDGDALAAAMQQQWPQAFLTRYDDRPATHEVTVRFDDGSDLSVRVTARDSLSVDVSSVARFAEFVAWWAPRAPGHEPDVRIYKTSDFDQQLPLRPETSAEDVLAAFG